MLLGGKGTEIDQKKSFKFDNNKQYDWIPNDPNSSATDTDKYGYSFMETSDPFAQETTPLTAETPSSSIPGYDQGTVYGSGVGANAFPTDDWEAAPPPTDGYKLHSSGYFGEETSKFSPFAPPKYREPGEKPLLIRVWESLTWVFVLSVHAVRIPRGDVPFGANFGGVNLYGIALWGIPICYLMEELYCNLAIALMTIANHNKLGAAAASDLASFTLAVYLGFWMMLGFFTLCRGMLQRPRRSGSAEFPLYNLRVISLLCSTSIPAAAGGFLWQCSLRKEYATKPKEIFNLHIWPNPLQPSSIVLAAAPFAWPLILVTVCLFFRLVHPRKGVKKAAY